MLWGRNSCQTRRQPFVVRRWSLTAPAHFSTGVGRRQAFERQEAAFLLSLLAGGKRTFEGKISDGQDLRFQPY